MLDSYRTVRDAGQAEIVIKRSRFIGHAKHVLTEAEAIRFIEEIKQQHKLASHNCSAYIVGERDEFQKQSDDGEPSGTAGKPILEVIKNQQLKNVVVVVTRYFGGVMLGAGGLIRAYAEGAVEGIAAAGPVYKVLHQEVRVTIDYTWHGKVENELKNRDMWMGDTEFTDRVTLVCLPLASQASNFSDWMTNITQGQANLSLGRTLYMDHEQMP